MSEEDGGTTGNGFHIVEDEEDVEDDEGVEEDDGCSSLENTHEVKMKHMSKEKEDAKKAHESIVGNEHFYDHFLVRRGGLESLFYIWI